MANLNFREVFIRLMVVSVLMVSLFSFIIITQLENNPENLIIDNTLINTSFGQLVGNLTDGESDVKTASTNFGSITPSESFGILSVASIVSPMRLFRGLIVGPYNVLIVLPAQFLGVPLVIIGILNAILTLLLILGIWAVWKGVFTN